VSRLSSSLSPPFCAALGIFVLAGRVHAAEPKLDLLARQGSALALDFCGTFIGERPEVTIAGTARKVPGLSVSEPLSLDEFESEAEIRDILVRLLELDAGDALRVAGFSARPSLREAPFAAVTADGDLCYIVVPSGNPAIGAALDARLNASGSAWRAETPERGASMWHRSAPYNEQVLFTYAAHSAMTAIVVALVAREASTPEDLAAQLRGAIAPCIEGLISGKPADTADFNGTFDLYKRAPHEKYPQVQVLDLRAMVGPRAWLQVRSSGTEFLCELLTSDQKLPFEKVMEVVNGVISGWPGAKAVEVKASDDRPAHTAWRVTRKGSRRKADISVSVDREDIAVVRVERADSGWWR
jgi:hypothetical protein